MSISNCMWKNKYFYFLFHNYVDDFDVIWEVFVGWIMPNLKFSEEANRFHMIIIVLSIT